MKYIAKVIAKENLYDREFTLSIKAHNIEAAKKDLFHMYNISEIVDIKEYDEYNFLNKNNIIREKHSKSYFSLTKAGRNYVR